MWCGSAGVGAVVTTAGGAEVLVSVESIVCRIVAVNRSDRGGAVATVVCKSCVHWSTRAIVVVIVVIVAILMDMIAVVTAITGTLIIAEVV